MPLDNEDIEGTIINGIVTYGFLLLTKKKQRSRGKKSHNNNDKIADGDGAMIPHAILE
jgi:hypothetical protein